MVAFERTSGGGRCRRALRRGIAGVAAVAMLGVAVAGVPGGPAAHATLRGASHAWLAVKDPTGDNKDGKPEGSQRSRSQQARSERKQIAAVAQSIDAALRMTPEEFKAWVWEVEPDGKNNAIGRAGPPGSQFAFPSLGIIPDPALGKIDTPVGPQHRCPAEPDFPLGCPGTDVLGDGYFVLNRDFSHRYPQVEHMSLLGFEPDAQYWATLVFYNGSVTLDLKDEKKGKVTVLFGTQIWPDGTKVPLAWVGNLELPHNPRLGTNQSGFTDQPAVSYAYDRNQISIINLKPMKKTREQLFSEFEGNVGKPLVVEFATSIGLQFSWRWSGYPAPNFAVDARIEGIEVNRFYHSVLAPVAQAFFAQDPFSFQDAIEAGEQSGIFLPSANPDVSVLQASITGMLANITSLDTVFAHLPLGFVVLLPGATGPKELAPRIRPRLPW